MKDELPITFEGPEPDGFDDLMWWVGTVISCVVIASLSVIAYWVVRAIT